jgi:hypothetical protein
MHTIRQRKNHLIRLRHLLLKEKDGQRETFSVLPHLLVNNPLLEERAG